MEKLIITAAICGAEVIEKYNPTVPHTVEGTVRKVGSAFEAGAAVVYVHVREGDGTPTQSHGRFRMVLDAIKEARPGVILVPSTGDAVGMAAEERLRPTELFPEATTLGCDTYGFGGDVFTNDMPTMRVLSKRMIENHIRPEYECLEVGHLDIVVNMANKSEVPGAPMQFSFMSGVPGCIPATAGNLDRPVKQIPAGSIQTIIDVGRGAWPMVAASIVIGGSVHVGFEDNIYLEKGHKVALNGELVEKIVRLARELDREVATPDEVRKILSLA